MEELRGRRSRGGGDGNRRRRRGRRRDGSVRRRQAVAQRPGVFDKVSLGVAFEVAQVDCSVGVVLVDNRGFARRGGGATGGRRAVECRDARHRFVLDARFLAGHAALAVLFGGVIAR